MVVICLLSVGFEASPHQRKIIFTIASDLVNQESVLTRAFRIETSLSLRLLAYILRALPRPRCCLTKILLRYRYTTTSSNYTNTDRLQLIQVTLENFNTQPDKIAIGRINESLLGIQQSRDLRLREAESVLRSKRQRTQIL